MSYQLKCRQCGGELEIIIRCNTVICLACGYEEGKEYHFANLFADAILNQEADGLDRTEYLLWAAKAFEDKYFLCDDYIES